MFARDRRLKSELFTLAVIHETLPAMLDIRVIREQADEVKVRLKARGGDHWKLIDEVLACDTARRAAETAAQALKATINANSKQIGISRSKGEDTTFLQEDVKRLKEEIVRHETDAEDAGSKQNDLLLNIPNLPHAECPVGDSE